jgi:tetratricopeptide (TPR) repeat protein
MSRFSGLVWLFVLTSLRAISQDPALLDSMRRGVERAGTVAEKVGRMDELSRMLMGLDPAEAFAWGGRMIATAEDSRDRRLMFDAYLGNGICHAFLADQKQHLDRAASFFGKALELARDNGMDREVGIAELQLSMLYVRVSDKDRALGHATQAFSMLSSLSDDSLRAVAYQLYGQVYLARNENILALRNLLSALRIAEGVRSAELLRDCYRQLADFYASIEDFDRAIDYMMMAYRQLDGTEERDASYLRVAYTDAIGKLFAGKNNHEIAIDYFERTVHMADSLKYLTLKIGGYGSLIGEYLRMDDSRRALGYLHEMEAEGIREQLAAFGIGAMLDMAYGVAYSQLGRFDSARAFLEGVRPVYEMSMLGGQRVGYFYQLARFYRRSGDRRRAIETYGQVYEMALKGGLLDMVRNSAGELDTLYRQAGDPETANRYAAVYYRYKDSIENQKRKRELVQLEAADEQQRQQRLQMELVEAEKRRDNIQYMAITMGIVVMFLSLVLLGMFRVPAGWIRAIGFFVFLLLFEFVFLVFKKNIYGITRGEPWKDLAFMIGLAAFLVPLHHWLEHRVLHYLTSHNRLTEVRDRIVPRRRESGGEG